MAGGVEYALGPGVSNSRGCFYNFERVGIEMNFVLTDEAMALAIKTLAGDGYLTLRMTRTGKNQFSMGMYHGKTKVLVMPDVTIHEGDIFELSDMKMKLDLKMT